MTQNSCAARDGGSAVYAADIGAETVLLDVERDRYYLAPASSRGRGAGRANGHWGQRNPALADNMPNREVWPSMAPRALPSLRALRALRRTARLLDTSFSAMVNHVRKSPTLATAQPPPIEDLLASFMAARPFFGRARVCRIDAPALCLLVRAYGYPARLVIGARLEPFGAHCWAQIGQTALNEPYEYIGQFTPIVEI